MAGPVYLKEGVKCWIALFTCGVYRAIHLEAVTTLSAEGFLQAFKRFVSRRGRPSVMYSDHGGNFTLSRKELAKVEWDKVKADTSGDAIEWKLIPPTAPWYGGWWERLVGVTKDVLKKMLGHACVTYEEFNTLLCECEGFINSRPLTYVAENEELIPLTPAMFLNDIRLNYLPEVERLDQISFKKRVRYICEIRMQMKQRFKAEYLSELVKFHKKNKAWPKVKIGDVVVVGSDNMKRQNWLLGRIEEIGLGKDRVPRVAIVKTKTGKLTRPLERLYPLEVEKVSSAEDADLTVTDMLGDNCSKDKRTDCTSPEASNQAIIVKTNSGRIVKRPCKLDL